MTNLLSAILWMSLGGTALGGILLLIQRLCKNRLPSGFYYGAWLVVLLRFCLPIGGLLPTGQTAEQQPAATVSSGVQAASGSAAPRTGYVGDGLQDSDYTVVYPVDALPDDTADSEASVQAAQAEPSAQEPLSDPGLDALRLAWDWLKERLASPRLWTGLWAIGAALYLARYVIGYKRFTRRLRTLLTEPNWLDKMLYDGIPVSRRPRLYRCGQLTTPMLLGVFHPTIVLPDRAYNPSRLENILRHELTHHQRRDILFKWLTVACCALHWFNPFILVLRHKLDQTCELSCDARLLRHMNASQKQAYGETLLDLAADRSLPAGVVATTFATEKRTLKERLEQIMTYKKKTKTAILLILAAALALCACGMIIGPRAAAANTETDTDTAQAVSQTVSTDAADAAVSDAADAVTTTVANTSAETSDAAELTEVTVSTVDEFLAAIAPNTIIVLEPGTYDLTTAADYGKTSQNEYYAWNEVNDGYELLIADVANLTIQAADAAKTELETEPRYANVLAFENCGGIGFYNITAGHTEAAGMCSGGVLYFDGCTDVNIYGAYLYGCGTEGIHAISCQRLYAINTAIYECSSHAVWAEESWDLQFISCTVRDLPEEDAYSLQDSEAWYLFWFQNCSYAAIVNCDIYDCNAQVLLSSASSKNVYFLGNSVMDSVFDYLIQATTFNPVVDDCFFGDGLLRNTSLSPFDGLSPVSPDGTELTWTDLQAMTQANAVYEGPGDPDTPELDFTETAEGTREVTVSTVDEFLAAIGPDTTIYLEAGTYSLYEAETWASYDGVYYYWDSGTATLVLTGVYNLSIIGAGKDNTTIQVSDRSAEILAFCDCSGITLSGFTAGHYPVVENSCSAGVLRFSTTSGVTISECGLFGCGRIGISAYSCDNIQVTDTEIYECTDGAAILNGCENVAFTGCDIHDCGDYYGAPIAIYDSVNVTEDGTALSSKSTY